MDIPYRAMLFGCLIEKSYHKIGFCEAKGFIHFAFCILHFAFCIFKLPDKPQFIILSTNSQTPHTADCAASLAVEKAICKLNPPV